MDLPRAVARRVWRWLNHYPPPPTPPVNRAPLPRAELAHHPRLHGLPHPTSWDWPTYLDPTAAPWLATLKDLYSLPLAFPASLSPEAGLLLHSLVRNIRPRTVIETGTWLGISSLWIASALHANADAAHLHTFDLCLPLRKELDSPDPRTRDFARDRTAFVSAKFREAGLSHLVTAHQGRSDTLIRAMHDSLRTAGGVQLAYLDGDHSVEGVCQDLWALEPILATGGYVLLHDIFPEFTGDEPGPRHLLDRIASIGAGLYEKCELVLSPANYGLAILRRLA
jgi:predicted O-methyltransferase YrrM